MAVSPVRLLPGVVAALLLAASPAGAQGALAFVPNHGQWDVAARFAASGGPDGGRAVWFTDDGWTLTLADGGGHATAVRMRFLGGRPVAPRGEGERPERRHYFRGGQAVTDVPAFDRLRWDGLYPGVDLLARQAGGVLEYDLCLQPGADASALVMACDGALDLTLDGDGALRIHTALGALRQPAPVTWQELPDGSRRAVACRYRRLDAGRFAFELPAHDPALPTVIDPELQWASFLGGTGFEVAQAVALGADGTVTVAGFTSAGGFPTTPGAYDLSANGGRDVCVTRFAADGSALLWSTLLGGAKDEEARALALDAAGGAVLAGWTASSGFPVTPGALDGTFNGGAGVLASDAFVTRLSPAGNALLFSTYLGGAQDELASAVAVAADGAVTVAGKTSSPAFPVTAGAFDTSWNGGAVDVGDAFVARLSASGAPVFATFLGGSADEFVNALAVAPGGETLVAGWTSSTTFPGTPGAFDATLGGTSDGFVARLSAGGGTLLAATLLGGGNDDNATALAIDDDGAIAVAGTTLSPNFPVTPGAPQPTSAGGTWYGDGFLARLQPGGGALLLATFLGGTGDDFPTGLAPDGAGGLVVAGWSSAANYPVTADAADATLSGSADGTLAIVDRSPPALRYASYLGAGGQDKVMALAALPGGRLVLAGTSSSSAFPVTPGAFDTHFDGLEGLIADAFVCAYDLGAPPAGGPDPWTDLGHALVGSAALLPRLTATGTLAPSSPGVVSLQDAASGRPAVLVVGTHAGAVPLLGGTLVPFPFQSVLPYETDALGGLAIPYEWPAGVVPGHTLYVQAWISDAGAPQGMSASNALAATAP